MLGAKSRMAGFVAGLRVVFASIVALALAAVAGMSIAKAGEDPAPTLVQARAILQASDRYRGGVSQGGRWTVSLRSTDGESVQTSRYAVKAKGTNALAECLEPARNRNELILFGKNALWFYRPGLRRPLALSARQRLIGEAANGDIAATNYAGDYIVESISSSEVAGQPAWLLALKAKEKTATYDRIRYWISKRDSLGVKAEFLTLQGETFKRATFEYKNQIKVDGQVYPFVSKMIIVNATFANQVTTLTYDAPSAVPVSDGDFNVNNLIR